MDTTPTNKGVRVTPTRGVSAVIAALYKLFLYKTRPRIMQAQGSPYEVLLKILLIGDTGSQKTELLQKYMGEVPGIEDSLGPTLGRFVIMSHNFSVIL